MDMSRLQPTPIIPQGRVTSQPIVHWKGTQVRLLVGPIQPPVEYTRAGNPCKRQPDPYLPGETYWAKLRGDGTIAIYPFEMAGDGYEIVRDAEEGTHYEFIA